LSVEAAYKCGLKDWPSWGTTTIIAT